MGRTHLSAHISSPAPRARDGFPPGRAVACGSRCHSVVGRRQEDATRQNARMENKKVKNQPSILSLLTT